jgi:hypothetical protein
MEKSKQTGLRNVCSIVFSHLLLSNNTIQLNSNRNLTSEKIIDTCSSSSNNYTNGYNNDKILTMITVLKVIYGML